MANVRCPMCSKLNTPDAEACSYCGARLKPVLPASPPPGSGAPRKDGEQDDAPDWLRSLRSDAPESGQDESSEPEAEAGDVPDWLSRIRSQSPAESQSEPVENTADETPDWLKGLQGGPPSEESDAGRGASSSEESPAGADWFGRLQDASAAPAETPPSEQQSGDTPDWLRGLADETFSEQTPNQASELPAEMSSETGQAGGEEDWMNMLSSWAPGESQPAQEEVQPGAAGLEDEDFSWLGGLEQASGTSEAAEMRRPEEPSAEEETFGLTGFLSELDQPAADETFRPEDADSLPAWGQEAAASGDELPDWLNAQPSGESPTDFRVPADSPAGAEDGGLPAWLQGFDNDSPASPAAPSSDEPETSIPSWLSSDDEASLPDAQLPRAEESAVGDVPSWLEEDAGPAETFADREDTGLPTWLSGAEAETPGPQPEAWGAPGSDENDSSLPAWMQADAEQTADAELEPGSMAQAESSTEELPDWFASLDETSASIESEPETPESVTPFGGAISYELLEPERSQPAVSSFSSENPPAEPVSSEPSGEDVPDWLREFESQPAAGAAVSPLIDAEPAVPVPALEGDQPFAVDLPDWLAEDEAAVEAAEQPVEMAGETLAQADLPEWVKEMRPIESIIPGEMQSPEPSRHAEKSGPLAGLPGILPAEELAARYRRPPVYSVKLHTSEKQRAQASQFETLLAQEMQPLLIPPQGKRIQGLLVRILVALLLIVALAVPPLMNMDPLAVPALGPDETRRMFEEIDASLAPDEAVLLAVDFEPALYGEMRLASQPVIEHLLEKNARIVVVSTRSSGPALAEQLLINAAVNHPQFNSQQNFINLGFLPGDMISLLAFARQPAFAAPATLGGELAWESPVLQEINGIQDFTSVIVLTDAAETGRIWVEQVKPLMGDIPLLMVTSAQAAPMMAPFVQSGQVTGMVGGMVGGFLYAQWAGQADTPAGGFLASYQVGMLLAFALTLIGGLFSGGMKLLKRNEKDEE